MAESFRSSSASPTTRSGAGGLVWNEMTDASEQIRPHWALLGATIGRWGIEERTSLVTAAGRMIDDLGTTFNVFSDVVAAGHPYELDPIPLVISPSDWTRVSAGLAQRIRLLDAVLADVYGPQQLLRDGLLPPDLVHSSAAFLNYASGVQPPGGKHLVTTACDLIRSASGAWSVLRDVTGPPGGLGQALENRNVMSNLLSQPFEAMRVARLGGFLDLERETIQSLALRRGVEANIVFLTPGFRHPSYFEHAYKARLLGFQLVEAADLTVRERRLFLKTLSGLRKIDGVICRVEDDGVDPLEHWKTSGEGIPGILETWRTGNVAMANAPGSGFASSPALMPFLPRICREWFGEEIKLPFVETWWLGQADVRRRILDQLHRFILIAASPKLEPLLPLQCSGLSPAARKQWAAAIEERPHDFVVQADVMPSEAPSLESRMIRQRPVVWRAFTLNAQDGPVALPGGLARVGKGARPPQLWPAHAGFTKDVWIPETRDAMPSAKHSVIKSSSDRQVSAPDVPSRIAEQLFWVGRCAERIELTTRLLRVTLRCLTGEAGDTQQEQLAACLTLLSSAKVIPEEMVIHPARMLKTLSGMIHDPAITGGIPALTRMLLFNAAAARDRLSDDTWRFFNRLESFVMPTKTTPGAAELLRTLDTLVFHLAAFAGMQAENMTRGQGWRFLEVGRRIERALAGLRLLRSAAEEPGQTQSQSQGQDQIQRQGNSWLLEPLLETTDSVMTYRRRHFSRPQLDAVIDLIFFDRTNPRSVAYQIHVIHAEAARFSGPPDFGLMPKIREQAQVFEFRFDDPRIPDGAEFVSLIESLEHFSDSLTQHFFSHSVRRVY
ncbi:MAG: circularly permuted type 2 ATP-grasp protein [Gloeobacteraceae cyanobacterium ES-bin-144]|nr:circularly permuted type 2 ATP-grasp protein [Verrucomicrobiales bacterium]